MCKGQKIVFQATSWSQVKGYKVRRILVAITQILHENCHLCYHATLDALPDDVLTSIQNL